jgi:hypothetical protein
VVIGEADRLEEAISLAQDTAISDNEQFGCWRRTKATSFLVYDDASRQWLPSDNPAFPGYKLPEEIILEISAAEKVDRQPARMTPARCKARGARMP